MSAHAAGMRRHARTAGEAGMRACTRPAWRRSSCERGPRTRQWRADRSRAARRRRRWQRPRGSRKGRYDSCGVKRILLTNFHPHQDGGGGHARYIRTILESELRKDFEFGVAAPEGSGVWAAGRALGAATFACPFPGHVTEIPQMLGAVRRFEAIFGEWQPDLVHVNGSRDQNIVVLWKALRGRSVACVRTHHAVRNIPNNAYNRWAYRKMLQGHIYVGHSARNISWADGSLTVPNARVIPDGVDVSHWCPVPKAPAFLAKYGVSPSDFVFGSHAGMGAHKRTDLFLHGAAIALKRGAPPFKVLLRGNEREIAASRSLARELGLDN